MNKEVKYSGFSAVPSDYESKDGELAVAINIVPEYGSLHVINSPTLEYSMVKGQRLLFIHKISNGNREHYLILDPIDEESGKGNLYFRLRKLDNDNETLHLIGAFDEVVSAKALGNIIILSHKSQLSYLWWNNDTHEYVVLGSRLPQIDIDFALNASLEQYRHNTGKLDYEKRSTSTPSEVEDILHTIVIPPDTIPFGGGGTGCLAIEDFTFEEGKRYNVKILCDIVSSYFTLYYNDPAETDCHFTHEKLGHTQLCGNSVDIVPDRTGPLHFAIVSFAMDSTGGTPFPSDYILAVPISVIISYSEVGDVEPETYIPAPTDANIDAMLGAANTFVKKQTQELSKFMFPFFVRYALRLYDGSHVALSAPILLVPNSCGVPIILTHREGGGYSDEYVTVMAFSASVVYKVMGVSNLSLWKNIVAGVDFFISAPAYTYDQSLTSASNHGTPFKVLSPTGSEFSDIFTISRKAVGNIVLDDGVVQKRTLKDEIFENLSFDDRFNQFVVSLSQYSHQDIAEDLASKSIFYKVGSIDSEELLRLALSEDFSILKMEKNSLDNLTARPVLEDNVIAYRQFGNVSLEDLNLRLHLYNGAYYLPEPKSPAQCASVSPIRYDRCILRVHLRTVEGEREVTHIIPDSPCPSECFWIYYPDNRAYRIEIAYGNADSEECLCLDIPLKTHDFLNGAYALAQFQSPFLFAQSSNSEDIFLSSEDNGLPVYSQGNLYLSEVNNPFVFRISNTVSIPVLEIRGIGSAAKALSQGQFGQYPLYAFTTDGVWALEMNAIGTYTARQPITRDVCINPNGITQIDSAVLFPTDRGIMLISGSQTQCITDVIANDVEFDVRSLPGMSQLHLMVGHDKDSCFPLVPFLDFISSCGMIYDYRHQRIIVFNKNYTYAYVYSLESKQWGLMYSNIESSINSYPEALAVDVEGAIVDFSNEGEQRIGLLVTRPLKLDAPDFLKTVTTVFQRGRFAKGHVSSVLYGSRNLSEWHLIRSSKAEFLRGFSGTPYKYFRIALLCRLDPGENIYGASVEFEPRLTNKMR